MFEMRASFAYALDVIAEMSLIAYNEGAPLIADVIAGMSKLGFRSVEICEVHRTAVGGILQMDMLFANVQLYEKYRLMAGLK